MRRFLFIYITVLFLLITTPVFIFSDNSDFYTLELQPGAGESKIILIGLSPNEQYFSYIELYSPFQGFSENYKAFARFVIVDVPKNEYAITPIQVSTYVKNNPLDQDCFSFFEYVLLLNLMKKAKPKLEDFGIIPGVLPVKALPFRDRNSNTTEFQRFHLFNGEMGNLAQLELEIMKCQTPGTLDIRLRSRNKKRVEVILQKDKKVPKWRSNVKNYRIAQVYFYGNHKKYIVVFIKLVFKLQNGKTEDRYMCVTGEITRVWENAFKWSDEEMFK